MENKKNNGEIRISPKRANYGKINRADKTKNKPISGMRVLTKVIACILVLLIIVIAVFLYIDFVLPKKVQEEQIEASEFSELSEEQEVSQRPIDPETGRYIYEKEEYLFLVNDKNPLSEEYNPEIIVYKNIEINAIMEWELNNLMEKALEDDIVLVFDCGYVSPEQQQQKYESKIDSMIKNDGYTKIMANAKAEDFVPKPMCSDNQTGLCVTFKEGLLPFEKSDEYLWLIKNVADYGFVFRYPKGSEKYTGQEETELIIRYVGVEDAIKMRQLDRCFEEYMAYLEK